MPWVSPTSWGLTTSTCTRTVPLLLMVLMSTVSAQLGLRPPATCAPAMDAYCAGPALGLCATKIKGMGGKLPLKAVKDVSASSSAAEWRCYSPSCLTPNGSSYKKGSHCKMSCSRNAELAAILQSCTHPTPAVPGRELRIAALDIWGTHARDCGATSHQ